MNVRAYGTSMANQRSTSGARIGSVLRTVGAEARTQRDGTDNSRRCLHSEVLPRSRCLIERGNEVIHLDGLS